MSAWPEILATVGASASLPAAVYSYSIFRHSRKELAEAREAQEMLIRRLKALHDSGSDIVRDRTGVDFDISTSDGQRFEIKFPAKATSDEVGRVVGEILDESKRQRPDV